MQLDPRWPTFHDILAAYKSCRLNKPASSSQIRFESHLGENLIDLLKLIHTGKYRPDPAKCFIVTHPKPREIFAAEFRDRVVHHLIVSQLEPIWDRKFIHSSFACRVGRGSHGAIRYAQKHVRRLSQGGRIPVWALQLDIEKFFVSIDRAILCNLLTQHARHPRLKSLIQAIYGNDARSRVRKVSPPEMFRLIPKDKSWFDQEPGQGIPIGNLTSQFGANVYLTGLDHFVSRSLKPAAYLRYMDDLTLLDTNPDKLQAMAEPINAWLQANRRQRLNPAKTKLTCLRDGIRYLGLELRQGELPAQPLQALPEPLKKWRLIQSLRRLEQKALPLPKRPHRLAPLLTTPETEHEIASVNSHMGSLVHSNTFRFRKKSLQKFLERTGEYQGMPRDLADAWSPFEVKKGYRAIKLR